MQLSSIRTPYAESKAKLVLWDSTPYVDAKFQPGRPGSKI
jgi:hypothetical protein